MAEEELTYIDHEGQRITHLVTCGDWGDSADGRFRVREVRGSKLSGLQKKVPDDREEEHGKEYQDLDHEARVGMRLSWHYAISGTSRDEYPRSLPRMLGHDMDGPKPFVLYASGPDPDECVTIERINGNVSMETAPAFALSLFGALRMLALVEVAHDGLGGSTVCWLDGEETVHITDFSTATFFGEARRSAGARGFAPPEQRIGLPAHPGDDVFAAGVLIYYAVTGTFPRANRPDVASRGPRFQQIMEGLLAPEGERPLAATVMSRFSGGPQQERMRDLGIEFAEGWASFDRLGQEKFPRPSPNGGRPVPGPQPKPKHRLWGRGS